MSAIKVAGAVALLAILTVAVVSWHESRVDLARLESTIAAQQQIINAVTAREQSRDAALQTTLTQIAAIKKSTQTPEQILRALPQYLQLPEPITLNAPSPAATQAGKGTADATSQVKFVSPVKETRDSQVGAQPTVSTQSQTPVQQSIASAQAPDSAGSPYPRPDTQAENLESKLLSLFRPRAEAATPTLSPPNSQPAAVSQPTTPPVQSGRPTDSSQASESSELSSPPQSSNAQSASLPAADLKPLFDYIQDCRTCQAQLTAARADLADEKSRTAALTRERDAALQAAKGGTFTQRLKRNAKCLVIGAAIAAAIANLHK